MNIFLIGSVPGQGGADQPAPDPSLLEAPARDLGRSLALKGHTAVVCSVFAGCVDAGVIDGYLAAGVAGAIELHHIDIPLIRQRLEELRASSRTVTLSPYVYAPPVDESTEALRYAWLLCQLRALDRAHVTIAVGGRLGGSTNLLLLLAEGRRLPVLPITFLGGAAREAYFRRQYELTDILGDAVTLLHDQARITEAVDLAERLARQHSGGFGRTVAPESPRFFISYARARPAEADRIEMILRRRNLAVFRDDSNFKAGADVEASISEAFHQADIVIVTWCREYACSPWCFDEFELALDRHAEGKAQLWIFVLDGTRVVPKRARHLIYYEVNSRNELEGQILRLVNEYFATSNA